MYLRACLKTFMPQLVLYADICFAVVSPCFGSDLLVNTLQGANVSIFY